MEKHVRELVAASEALDLEAELPGHGDSVSRPIDHAGDLELPAAVAEPAYLRMAS